ncbi:MAG TPA: chalcone isomerase family protein [Polaromonas sp.]|uniref:chalcone isomerase family protein n=1 Tax=Polaromonas sp. TaxID=1869339 RepID=UPI002D622407|nr:chalcone isomerase family protein [Polaromonas sp.]HYW58471.1 chalcone isomerase family protein [Polaromonas sp.]
MNLMKQCIAIVAGLTLSWGAAAATVDVAGVKIEDATDVRGSKLVLNGAGVRYKAVFKVYAAGLYLTKKAATTDEVLATPGAKRMQIVMMRDIDSNELGKLFSRGVGDNSPKAEMSKLVPGLIRMGQIFSDQKKLMTGDVFTIDWVPGSGTVITIKGVPQGEPFKEVEFFNAMMRIWLGPEPADWKLKEALLGKAG